MVCGHADSRIAISASATAGGAGTAARASTGGRTVAFCDNRSHSGRGKTATIHGGSNYRRCAVRALARAESV